MKSFKEIMKKVKEEEIIHAKNALSICEQFNSQELVWSEFFPMGYSLGTSTHDWLTIGEPFDPAGIKKMGVYVYKHTNPETGKERIMYVGKGNLSERCGASGRHTLVFRNKGKRLPCGGYSDFAAAAYKEDPDENNWSFSYIEVKRVSDRKTCDDRCVAIEETIIDTNRPLFNKNIKTRRTPILIEQKNNGIRSPMASLKERAEYIIEFNEDPDQNHAAFARKKGRKSSTCAKWLDDQESILERYTLSIAA